MLILLQDIKIKQFFFGNTCKCTYITKNVINFIYYVLDEENYFLSIHKYTENLL